MIAELDGSQSLYNFTILFAHPVIHLVGGDVLDDGMDALSVDSHCKDLITRLVLKTNTFGCALEAVGNAGKSTGLDNLKYSLLQSTC